MFSKQKSQRLPKRTVWDHAIELLPNTPKSLAGRLLRLPQDKIREIKKFTAEHLQQGTIRAGKGPYMASFFFVKKATTSTRLPTPKQIYQEKQKCIPVNPPGNRQAGGMHSVHEVRHKMGIQQHQNQRGRQMESRVLNAPRPLQTPRNVLWTHKLPGNIPSNDERNL